MAREREGELSYDDGILASEHGGPGTPVLQVEIACPKCGAKDLIFQPDCGRHPWRPALICIKCVVLIESRQLWRAYEAGQARGAGEIKQGIKSLLGLR